MAQNIGQDPTRSLVAMVCWINVPLVLNLCCISISLRTMLDAGGDTKMSQTPFLPSGSRLI